MYVKVKHHKGATYYVGMDDKTPQDILEELDQLLKETPVVPSYSENLDDPEYTQQYIEMQTLSSVTDMNVELIVETASKMIATHCKQTFQLCSIGCGDGEFDKRVLTKLTKAFPNVDLQYVGVDVNELSCQTARETLKLIQGVKVEVTQCDLQQLGPGDLKPCDLIIMVHVLYYVEAIQPVLSYTLKLLKPAGCLIIVNAHRYPLSELYDRFWLHEHKKPLWFSDSILNVLEKMAITYHVEVSQGPCDVSHCFKRGFEHPSDHYFLDHITHTKMRKHSPTVVQTCIDYLSSIAEGKPEKYILTEVSDVIFIKN